MSGTKALKAQGAYSRPEGPTNFITYVLAAGLSFVGLVFLLLKASGNGAAAIVSAALFGVIMLFVFTVGALVHILPPSPARNVLSGIDRSAVGLLVAGVFTPVLVCGLASGAPAWGYTLFGIAAACAIAATAVTASGVKQYKLICLVLYVVMGLTCTLRIMRTVSILGTDFYWWLLGGGAAYFIGAVFFLYGKLSFGHTVWHAFVMCGATLHFVCVYVYLI